MRNINFVTGLPFWVYYLLVYLFWVMGWFIVKALIFRSVRVLARPMTVPFGKIFIEAIDWPLTILIFTSGGIILQWLMPQSLESAGLEKSLLFGFKTAAIIAIFMFFERFLSGLVKIYSPKVDILRTSGGFVRGLIRVTVIGLGLLILLDNFGISITPVIASLGIGSLALALALQPTLENLFAGIQVVIDKPIQIGQFIKIESGEEGYVHMIGWRSTWIRMLPNNMVIIPNKILINSKIINYDYPGKELAVLVQVGVHYASDLDQVERVTLEVARQVLREVPGGVANFEPLVRYHTFADSSIGFTVVLQASQFVENYLLKHEFIKRLQKRYAKEGITIPYPVRAINYAQEKAFDPLSSPRVETEQSRRVEKPLT